MPPLGPRPRITRPNRTTRIAQQVLSARPVRHAVQQAVRPPTHLYTPLTAQGRHTASVRLGTTRPHGRGRLVAAQSPKHPLKPSPIITHEAVQRLLHPPKPVAPPKRPPLDQPVVHGPPQGPAGAHLTRPGLGGPLGHALKAYALANQNEQIKSTYDPGRLPKPLGKALNSKTVARAFGHQTTSVANNNVVEAAIPSGKIVQTNPKAEQAIGRVAQNAAKDALNTPAQAVASTYHIAHAGIKAAGGDTSELKQVGHSLANDTFVGNLVQGNFKKAGQIAQNHPLNSALEVSGVKAVLGRGVGATLRHAPSKDLRRIASTKRAPKILPGTRIAQKQQYSPDLINKGVQKAVEAIGSRHAGKVEAKAAKADAAGNVDRAVELRQRTAKKPQVNGPEIRRRVDEHVDMGETIRRAHRPVIIKAAKKVTIKKGGTAQVLVTQNIVRASRNDLAKYHAELQHQYDHGNLSNVQKAANRGLRKQIRAVVDKKGVDYAKVEKAARDYQALTMPLQQKLQAAGVLGDTHAELTPYAVRKMGATPTKEGPAIQGALVPPAVIKAHMAANDVPAPAFITQAPNMRGAKNFFVASHSARGIPTKIRTGKATLQGTFDAHPDVLTEGATRMQGLVDAHENFKRFVSEFGHRASQDTKTGAGVGRVLTFPTRDLAQKTADGLMVDHRGVAVPGQTRFRAIRTQPFQGRSEQFHQLLEDVSAEHQGSHPHMQTALLDALQGKPGEGPWALVPEVAADQLEKHVRLLGAGTVGKTGQLVNSAFRRTVLATNPRWLTGNVAEAGLRSTILRAGPRSYLTMRRTLKALPPSELEQLQGRAFSGGHYSFADRSNLHRSAEQFRDTRMEPVARALGTFWRTPGPKQAAAAWHAWTTAVFGGNGWLETQFQLAMGGRYVRKELMDPNAIKTGAKAVQQAAEGLKNTNEQVALARYVDRAYGKYSKFSPAARQAIAYYTPFVAWSLNAVKFAYSVLPRDHPVLTGLLAAATNATEQWRKDHGLDKFMSGRLPDFLQGSIPKGSGHVRVSRYTPFGFFADPLGGAASAVLPQADSVLQGLQGRDFLGRQQHTKDGQPLDDLSKAKLATQSWLESVVPGLGLAKQIQSKGVGPALNPFAPTVSKPKSSGGGSAPAFPGAGGGGGSGGTFGLTAKYGPDTLMEMGTGAATDAIQKALDSSRFDKQVGKASTVPTAYKVRLFAHPQRPGSKAHGGKVQIAQSQVPSLTATPKITVKPASPKLLKKLAQAKAQAKKQGLVLVGTGKHSAVVPSGVPAAYKTYLAKYGHIADKEAHKYGLGSGAELLAKMLKLESGYNQGAVSPKGAKSAAQFMPADRQQAIQQWGVDPYKDPESAVHAMALRMGKGSGLAGYNPGSSTYISQVLAQNVGGKSTVRVTPAMMAAAATSSGGVPSGGVSTAPTPSTSRSGAPAAPGKASGKTAGSGPASSSPDYSALLQAVLQYLSQQASGPVSTDPLKRARRSANDSARLLTALSQAPRAGNGP